MSHEDGVTKIKKGAYVKDFLKGITKNEKYCVKVVGSVEWKINPSWLGPPSIV